MKMPGKCTGPKYLANFFWKWRKKYLGREPRFGKKGGHERCNIDLVQEMLRPCETEDGTKKCELHQARASGPKYME